MQIPRNAVISWCYTQTEKMERILRGHLPHPVIGEDMLVNGNPVKLMGTPVEITRHAPLTPGVDNEEVYKGVFGLTDAQFEDLKAKGAI